MTDRIKALTVVLEHDMHDDDVQSLVDAIFQLRNVAAVKLNVVDMDDYANRQQIAHDLRKKLFEVLK